MLNTISQGECPKILETIPDNYIDLTLTSPPYDNLRNYHNIFDFPNTAKQLLRITKNGGIIVWIVNDQTIKGSESLTSFKQAILFKDIGFNIHDTMIFQKNNPIPLNHNRYEQQFEYMFVISKGKPKTFNPILTEIKNKIKPRLDTHHQKYYKRGNKIRGHKTHKIKFNIWNYNIGYNKESNNHPAPFPEQLAHDHIISWSNPNDTILDPFVGSGTTTKIAKQLNRNYIGFDINPTYVQLAIQRTN